MRNDRIIPGVILVALGAIFLLHNYGFLHFHWSNFVYLWPIFIIIGGVNLIFAHNKSAWATLVKLGVIIIGFGLLLFGNFGNKYNFWPRTYFDYSHHNNRNDRDNNDSDDSDDDDDDNDSTSTSSTGVVKMEGNSVFNEPYHSNVNIARLNISGGATTYNLSDTTNQLFNASTKEYFGKYNLSHRQQDSVYVLNFDMKDSHVHGFNWDDKKSNSATFKLNPNPEWEINVETGATQLNFDLSKFKIKSLKLSGGAAAFDVTLGQPLATTRVDVSTSAASVDIRIPKNAACHIKTDSGLSSDDFEGFTKNSDNNYETPGFATAKNKMYIKIDGVAASFNVKRY